MEGAKLSTSNISDLGDDLFLSAEKQKLEDDCLALKQKYADERLALAQRMDMDEFDDAKEMNEGPASKYYWRMRSLIFSHFKLSSEICVVE